MRIGLVVDSACDLPGGFQPGHDLFIAGDEFSFGVCDGQVHRLDAGKEDALRSRHILQPDPTIFELAGVIVGERCGRAMWLPRRGAKVVTQEYARLK